MDNQEPDEDEENALKKFKERDKQIDGLIDGVIQNLEVMGQGLDRMDDVSLMTIYEIRFIKRMLSYKIILKNKWKKLQKNSKLPMRG